MNIDNKTYFECLKCNKHFDFNSELERHTNKKISCNLNEREQYNMIKRTCILCDKVLLRLDSMSRHRKICKGKILIKIDDEVNENDKVKPETVVIENHDEILASLIKEMKEMRSKISKLETENEDLKTLKSSNKISKKVSGKGTLIEGNMLNNTQNTVNNIHNEIKIIAYGKEDLSFITDDNYKMLLNKGFKSVQNLVEYIHLNQNKPENQNIYVSNMRDNYILIFDGQKWQLKERDDVLQEMIDNNTEILSEKFEVLIKTLDEGTIKKFKRFLDEKDEDRVIDQIKKDLKLLLYNRKQIKEVSSRFPINNNLNKPKQIKIDESIKIEPKNETNIIEPKNETNIIEPKEEIIIKTYKQRKTRNIKSNELKDNI